MQILDTEDPFADEFLPLVLFLLQVPSCIFLAERHEIPDVYLTFPQAIEYGMLPLQLFSLLGMVRYTEELIFLELEIFESPESERP